MWCFPTEFVERAAACLPAAIVFVPIHTCDAAFPFAYEHWPGGKPKCKVFLIRPEAKRAHTAQ